MGSVGPVFVTIQGKPLRGISTGSIQRRGSKILLGTCLRYTFASHLAMTGVDFRTLAELMGHEKQKEFALQLRTK
jgi:integrase